MTQQYRYGAVLTLEQDDTFDYYRECCSRMRELAMNTVVIWPPAFYENGKPVFRQQKLLLDAAAEQGIGVIVELTGQVANLEYYPDCIYSDEVAVLEEDGLPARRQNGLGELNYNHPRVREALRRFLETAAAELKEHPALAGWDVWNETHFRSFDAFTMEEFRRFLKKKYSSIEELNRVWKKSYTDFAQIRRDPVLWASIMPEVDWEEFRTENLAACCREWADVLRAADPDHPVIADNVMTNAVWSEFGRGTDDWKVAAAVDCFGISFYPKTGGRLLRENAAWLRALTFDGAAAAGGGRFLVSEMQSHGSSEIFSVERVSGEELTLWNLEALMHGSVGVVYWKWTPFRSGIQLGGRGLVLADGSPSPRAAAVGAFGKLLERHPDLCGLRVPARAAILYDRINNIMVKAVNSNVRRIIGDAQPAEGRFGVYRRAFERNIPLRIVTPETLNLDGVDVLFLPYSVTLETAAIEKLRRFVLAGGTLVANYPFVDFDPEGRLYREIPGGPLNDLIGARHVDIDEQNMEVLELLPETEVIDRNPMVLRRKTGRGAVVYAGMPVWNGGADAACERIFDLLCEMHPGIVAVEANTPVSLASGMESDYLLVANAEAKACCRIGLDCEAEVIFGPGRLSRDHGTLLLEGAKNTLLKLKRHTLPPLMRIPENRVWRTYLGGKTLDGIAGRSPAEDSHFPEDWIASCTAAVNPGRRPEGLSRVLLDGTGAELAGLLARDPVRMLGQKHVERFGAKLGFLLKYLDSSIRLHLQCHPTVEFSKRHLNADSGKTEGYIILGVRPECDPYIYLGFQRPPAPEEFKRMIEKQETSAIEAAFDRIAVKPGDVFLVPGGFPHAIGEGVFMIEIMEPTDFAVRVEFERGGYLLPESARFMGRDVDFAVSMFDFTPRSAEEIRECCFIRPECVETVGESKRYTLFDRRITDRFRAERFEIRGEAQFEGEGLRVLIVTAGSGTVEAGSFRMDLQPFDRVLVPAATAQLRFRSETGLELVAAMPPAAE